MLILLVWLVTANSEKVGVELDEDFYLEWEFVGDTIEFSFTVSAI